MLRNLVVAIALVLGALPASAQRSAVDRAIFLSLEMQKAGVTAQELGLVLEAANRRIAELEKLCGDPCKPKPPEGQK